MAPSRALQRMPSPPPNFQPAPGRAGHFLPTEHNHQEDTKENLLRPLTIPDPHDPLPTPMDTSLPHTSQEGATIPFGTNTPAHLSPSLQSLQIPAGTMMARASTPVATMDQTQGTASTAAMSSLGALIPMDEGHQQHMDMQSDQPLPHRGLMANNHNHSNRISPSQMAPPDHHLTNSPGRGLNIITMEDIRARSPASTSSSSRVFGSGRRDGSRGLGTPPPPPAITTTAGENMMMDDQDDQRVGRWGFETGAIGMPPTPVSANTDTNATRGLRQTSRRRSPPGALVLGTAGGVGLGMGLPSPMLGTSKSGPTMKLGVRAASAFSPRVASPLSALAGSSNGPRSANSPHHALTPTPLTPASTTTHQNSFQQQQMQAARRGLYLHSQPSSPSVQGMTGNANVITPTSALQQQQGMFTPTTESTQQLAMGSSPHMHPHFTGHRTSAVDLEQPPQLTSSMEGMDHGAQLAGHYYHEQAPVDSTGAAAADQNDWDVIQAFLQGRADGYHHLQPQAQDSVVSLHQAALEHHQGNLASQNVDQGQYPRLRHRSSEEGSHSSSSAISGSTTSTPLLPASLPSRSTPQMYPMVTQQLNENQVPGLVSSISTGLPLEGLSLASAVSETHPCPPLEEGHLHQAGVSSMVEDRTRPAWASTGALAPEGTTSGMGFDLGQGLQPQILHPTPSRAALNDRTQQILAMGAASVEAVTPRTSLPVAAEGSPLTGLQQQQAMTAGHPAGDFLSWSFVPVSSIAFPSDYRST